MSCLTRYFLLHDSHSQFKALDQEILLLLLHLLFLSLSLSPLSLSLSLLLSLTLVEDFTCEANTLEFVEDFAFEAQSFGNTRIFFSFFHFSIFQFFHFFIFLLIFEHFKLSFFKFVFCWYFNTISNPMFHHMLSLCVSQPAHLSCLFSDLSCSLIQRVTSHVGSSRVLQSRRHPTFDRRETG